MSSRITARPRLATRRRTVIGLVTVLWLNMALLPCAMALQSAAMCPHCPPAEDHEMASHHGHGGHSEEPSRVTVQSECCDYEEVKIDARVIKPESCSAPLLFLIASPANTDLLQAAATQSHCTKDPPGHGGASPPLHVLNCVYLD